MARNIGWCILLCMSIHVYVYGMSSNCVCWYDFAGLVHGRIDKPLARHFGHEDMDQSWNGTRRSLGPHQKIMKNLEALENHKDGMVSRMKEKRG